jgi:hypothetical protein
MRLMSPLLAVVVVCALTGLAADGGRPARGAGAAHSAGSCGWRVVSSPRVSVAERPHGELGSGELVGVAAISPKNVWTIGRSIEHWNGVKWTVYKPVRRASDQQLNAIAAVSPADIWVVGGDPAVGDEPGRLIDHWNGRSWAKVSAPQSDFLSGVAVSPAGDVWTAGGMPVSDSEDRAYAAHWDGLKWTGLVPPAVDIYPDELYGIAPISAHDVLVVGNNGYAARWDGTEWTELASPIWTKAIAATSETDAWAVGGGVEHWNGVGWTKVHLGLPAKWFPNLRSVSAVGPNDVWAVGQMSRVNSSNHVVNQGILAAHWNGTTWTRRPTPNLHAGFSELRGISTLPNGDAWAVGDYWTSDSRDIRPLIERYVHC